MSQLEERTWQGRLWVTTESLVSKEQRCPVTLLRTFLTTISSLVHRCLEESILVYI